MKNAQACSQAKFNFLRKTWISRSSIFEKNANHLFVARKKCSKVDGLEIVFKELSFGTF